MRLLLLALLLIGLAAPAMAQTAQPAAQVAYKLNGAQAVIGLPPAQAARARALGGVCYYAVEWGDGKNDTGTAAAAAPAPAPATPQPGRTTAQTTTRNQSDCPAMLAHNYEYSGQYTVRAGIYSINPKDNQLAPVWTASVTYTVDAGRSAPQPDVMALYQNAQNFLQGGTRATIATGTLAYRVQGATVAVALPQDATAKAAQTGVCLYGVSWGDGISTASQVDTPSCPPSLQYTYKRPGTYPVQAAISGKDAGGLPKLLWTGTVNVTVR